MYVTIDDETLLKLLLPDSGIKASSQQMLMLLWVCAELQILALVWYW